MRPYRLWRPLAVCGWLGVVTLLAGLPCAQKVRTAMRP
jgi:hypothetical protein